MILKKGQREGGRRRESVLDIDLEREREIETKCKIVWIFKFL